MADFYPRSMDARRTWHLNIQLNLATLATKYNITPAQVTQLESDSDWMNNWVQVRNSLDATKQQVTKYFNEISGNDPSLDPPAPINFAIGPGPEVPPGIEFRTREIARQIKGHAAYSQADGELLGIVSDESEPPNFNEMTAEFTVRTLADFELEASFRRNGADAMRFEFRRKGGAWQQAAFLVSSPGTFTVPPTTPGTGEQIELRGILVKKNADVGSFSAFVPAFVAP